MCPVFSLAHVGALDNTALLFQLPFLCPLFSSITLVVLICGLISYQLLSLSLSLSLFLSFSKCHFVHREDWCLAVWASTASSCYAAMSVARLSTAADKHRLA